MGPRKGHKGNLAAAVVALRRADQAQRSHLLEIITALPGAGGVVVGHAAHQKQVVSNPPIPPFEAFWQWWMHGVENWALSAKPPLPVPRIRETTQSACVVRNGLQQG
jgi:hypothetical protein